MIPMLLFLGGAYLLRTERKRGIFFIQTLKYTHTNLNKIFEDILLFEEGAYRVYVTDEKNDIDPKDVHN